MIKRDFLPEQWRNHCGTAWACGSKATRTGLHVEFMNFCHLRAANPTAVSWAWEESLVKSQKTTILTAMQSFKTKLKFFQLATRSALEVGFLGMSLALINLGRKYPSCTMSMLFHAHCWGLLVSSTLKIKKISHFHFLQEEVSLKVRDYKLMAEEC